MNLLLEKLPAKLPLRTEENMSERRGTPIHLCSFLALLQNRRVDIPPLYIEDLGAPHLPNMAS